MIPELAAPTDSPFPPPEQAAVEPNGLLAWGGDLDPARLINAYRHGIFPWYSPGQPILWWSPEPRVVLVPQQVHIARRLSRLLRQQRYRLSADRDFAAVIEACARRNDKAGETWITADMQAAYTELHQLGHAHSIEVWDADGLAGGLYGVSLGRIFFAESMFSRQANCSKIALVTLCRVLASHRFPLIDCQIPNPHLERLGAAPVSRGYFTGVLASYVDLAEPITDWQEAFDQPIDWC